MDNRAAIPVLALLGLSFTDCGGDESTIVGEWHAVEVDGDARPMVEQDGDLVYRTGFALDVDDDLSGELSYYAEYEQGPLTQHSEYGGDLLVDDLGAHRFKLVVDDFIGLTSEPYYYSSGNDGGAPLHADLARPIAAAQRPAGAPATFTLTCALDGDTLTCDREDVKADDDLKHWVFRRKAD